MNVELTPNMQARLEPDEGKFGISIATPSGNESLGLFAYNVCEWDKAVEMAKMILVLDKE